MSSVDRRLHNKNSLEYIYHAEAHLRRICVPLFSNTDISYFEYIRIFNDNRRIYISTNSNWVERYIDQDFFDLNTNAKLLSLGRYYPNRLWATYQKDKVLSAFHQEGIWNGFSIVESLEDSICYYAFATNPNNDFINDFYLNNLDVLWQFIFYFKEQAKDLINYQNDKIIYSDKPLPDVSINKEKECINKLIQATKVKKYFLPTSHSLSPRQVECLYHLSQGRTAKEIAHITNLSTRTIECYINVMKVKMGSYRKTDLVKIFNENNLPWFT